MSDLNLLPPSADQVSCPPGISGQSAIWRIDLLGGLRAVRGSQVVSRFRSHKTGALLAYLAYHLRHAHPRELLVDMLWPEGGISSGSQSLSVSLSSLRDCLEPPGIARGTVILASRSTVRLNPETVSTDVGVFEAFLGAAKNETDRAERLRLLAGAVEQYRGGLLPGHYQNWIVMEQARLLELHLDALLHLADELESQGKLHPALDYAWQAMREAPHREEACQRIMRLYTAIGEPTSALERYQQFKQHLQQEFGREPSLETKDLFGVLGGMLAAPDDPSLAPSLRPGDRRSAFASPRLTVPLPGSVEGAGGALPLNSRYYIQRSADQEFCSAVRVRGNIVLVKGARQVGKSSLLARGLQHAQESGCAVVLTDFRKLSSQDLASASNVFRALAEIIVEQLDLEVRVADVWDECRGPSRNFERFLRRKVLAGFARPLVWGMDEIDCLFPFSFSSEVFALFRSWYNEASMEPRSPWSSLVLAMAYRTEAHLLITDPNLSPFNVGTQVRLDAFSPDEVGELNRRLDSPLRTPEEIQRMVDVFGGHPYLTYHGLHEMTSQGIGLAALEALAATDEGPFGTHLRQVLASLTSDPEVCEVVRGTLRSETCPPPGIFHRLRNAGIFVGDSQALSRPLCQVYADYLCRHLL